MYDRLTLMIDTDTTPTVQTRLLQTTLNDSHCLLFTITGNTVTLLTQWPTTERQVDSKDKINNQLYWTTTNCY